MTENRSENKVNTNETIGQQERWREQERQQNKNKRKYEKKEKEKKQKAQEAARKKGYAKEPQREKVGNTREKLREADMDL